MPKIDLSAITPRTGSIYPAEFAGAVAGRTSLRAGDAGGLTQFGANIVTLPPGTASSLRHWHLNEDEFVIMLDGELMLAEDEGETRMTAGDCAAFPAGRPNGHCFVNRSAADARFLVVGTRAPHEVGTYADVDLMVEIDAGTPRFTRKDGSEYIAPQSASEDTP